MRITLEETIHGKELEIGTPILIDIISKSKDQGRGYFKKIDDRGVTFSAFLSGCFTSDIKYDAFISMEHIGEIYQVSQSIVHKLRIRRYLDNEQNLNN